MANPSGAFTVGSVSYESSVSKGSSEGWGIYRMNSALSSNIYQSGDIICPVSRQVRFIIKF